MRRTWLALLVAAPGALPGAGAAEAGSAALPAAFVSAPGAPGNRASMAPDVSGTGRFVAFASDATNLVAGDTNARKDIFIRDVESGVTRLISRGPGGVVANGASYAPTISDDGRFVAFTSDASNLVAGDTNSVRDVFRADILTGTVTRVNPAVRGGGQSNAASDSARISGNGDAIAFVSKASNLVTGDTNQAADVFVRDVGAATTRRVSLAPTGDQFLAASREVSISSNGVIVGFEAPSGGTDGVYQWSRALGRTVELAEVAVDSPRASNAGVSYVQSEYFGECYGAWATITGRPASRTFTISNGDCTGDFARDYTVNQQATLAVVSTGYNDYVRGPALLLIDRDYRLDEDPRVEKPVAIVNRWADNLAISADGSTIVFTTDPETAQQVMMWKWASGAIQVVSVR